MDNKFARSNYHSIFKWAFRSGLVAYTVSFVATTNAFSAATETAVTWKANSAGTLIFGIRDQADRERANLFLQQGDQTRGALTLRSHSTFSFGWESNERELTQPLPSRPLDPEIALTSMQTSALSVNRPVISNIDAGLAITPMEITFADSRAIVGEEINPVPEPATWIAAALVAGAITWSQRRRFKRIFGIPT